ncbi:uncharacterized protein LOC134684743 [Mytilus trossulus]|uniref:uncharacterized protein LOC134684743 n=1 Tax=Mytilus trossulus TaxID=6551 RepID=UPI003004BFD9
MAMIFTGILFQNCAACVSSKNNTTIYACVGENVTLSCPPAGVNKTVSWFRKNVSKNPITTLYGGTKGKGANLQPNTEVNVNIEKGEFNLTIMNLTKADNGTYQCLHDMNFTSWLFHLTIEDYEYNNSGSQSEGNNISCTSNVSEYKTGEGVFIIDTNIQENDDEVLNLMWWYVMCCGLIAAAIAILSYNNPTFHKGLSGGSTSRKEVIVV